MFAGSLHHWICFAAALPPLVCSVSQKPIVRFAVDVNATRQEGSPLKRSSVQVQPTGLFRSVTEESPLKRSSVQVQPTGLFRSLAEESPEHVVRTFEPRTAPAINDQGVRDGISTNNSSDFHDTSDPNKRLLDKFTLPGGKFELFRHPFWLRDTEQHQSFLEDTSVRDAMKRAMVYYLLGGEDELNRLLGGLRLKLLDSPIEKDFGGLEGSAKIKSVECWDFRLGTLSFNPSQNQDNKKEILVPLQIRDLTIACEAHMSYKAFWGSNYHGKASFKGACDVFDTMLKFTSNVEGAPPVGSQLVSCAAPISLQHLSLHLGSAELPGFLNDAVRNIIQPKLDSILCDQIDAFGADQVLTDASQSVAAFLAPHIPCVRFALPGCLEKHVEPDLLASEKAMNKADLIDLSDSNDLMKQLRGLLNEALAAKQNSTQPDGTVKQDLGINIMVQDFTNGTGTFDFFQEALILMEDHDKFLSQKVTLDKLFVSGLDTWGQFNPLTEQGNYTLRNSLHLRNLSVNFTVGVVLEPYMGSDSMILDGGGKLPKSINAAVKLDDIFVDFALISAMSYPELYSIMTGGLLDVNWACLHQAFHVLNVTWLNFTLGDIDFQVAGESHFVDNLLTGALQAVDLMFKQSALAAATHYFATDFTQTINRIIQKSMQSRCPLPINPSGTPVFVNYETDPMFQLIHKEIQGFTELSGASGNLLQSAVSHLTRAWKSTLTNKSSASGNTTKLNDVIAKATSGMNAAGVPGVIESPEAFSSYSKGDGANQDSAVTIKVTNLRLSGLVPLHHVQILQPDSPGSATSDPYDLNSSFGIGKPEPLTLSANLLFKVESPDVNSHNEFTLTINLRDLFFVAYLWAKVDMTRLGAMRFEHLLNPFCFAATLPQGGLDFKNLRLTLRELNINIQCIKCSSPGLHELSDSWSTWPQGDEARVATEKFNEVFAAIFDSLVNDEHIDLIINDAALQCGQATGKPLPWVKALTPQEAAQKKKENHSAILMNVVLLTCVLLWMIQGCLGRRSTAIALALVGLLCAACAKIGSQRVQFTGFLAACALFLSGAFFWFIWGPGKGLTKRSAALFAAVKAEMDLRSQAATDFFLQEGHGDGKGKGKGKDVKGKAKGGKETGWGAPDQQKLSLFSEPSTPRWAKVVIPGLLLACAVFFVLAHRCVLFHVCTSLDLGEERMWVSCFDGVSKYELLELSYKAAHKKADESLGLLRKGASSETADQSSARPSPKSAGPRPKELATIDVPLLCSVNILAFCSMVWPTLRFILMIEVLFGSLKLETRSCLVRFLHMFSKWSMLDVFLLALLTSAFCLHFQNPALFDGFSEGFFALQMRPYPGPGLLCNVCYQLLSQLALEGLVRLDASASNCRSTEPSNAGLQAYEEDEIIMGDVSNQKPALKEKSASVALCSHAFTGAAHVLRLRTSGKGVLLPIILLSCLVLTAGLYMDSSSITVYGIAGAFLDWGATTSRHFQVSEWQGMQRLAALGDSGTLIFVGVLVLFVVIVPVARILTLTVLWFCPASRQMQIRLMCMANSLLAWQYLEVHLLAVICTVPILERVVLPVDYLGSNTAAWLLLSGLRIMSTSGLILPEDVVILGIRSKILFGWVLLALAIVPLHIAHQVIIGGANVLQLNLNGKKQFHRKRGQIFEAFMRFLLDINAAEIDLDKSLQELQIQSLDEGEWGEGLAGGAASPAAAPKRRIKYKRQGKNKDESGVTEQGDGQWKGKGMFQGKGKGKGMFPMPSEQGDGQWKGKGMFPSPSEKGDGRWKGKGMFQGKSSSGVTEHGDGQWKGKGTLQGKGSPGITAGADAGGWTGSSAPWSVIEVRQTHKFEGKLGIHISEDLTVMSFSDDAAREFWQIGDQVTAVNGVAIATRPEFKTKVSQAKELPLVFTVMREGGAGSAEDVWSAEDSQNWYGEAETGEAWRSNWYGEAETGQAWRSEW